MTTATGVGVAPGITAPPVALDRLTRRFDGAAAVDGLTFEVGAGELFGIVGPDGAGKTTTLRMLAGVLPPTSGDARIGGESVAESPERVKPSIAYMPQRFGLYEDLTVRENLDFYADLYRVPREARPERLERLYTFSRLGEFEDRLAGDLSGGMKQKLSLSCALIHQPAVLLLDEPTFGVDPISRRELWKVLRELSDDGGGGGAVTIVMTTSYLDEAERCDRIALLDRGRMLALDDPDRLRDALPGTLVVVRADDPRRARDLARSLPGVRTATLFGETLHVMLGAEGNGRDAEGGGGGGGTAAGGMVGGREPGGAGADESARGQAERLRASLEAAGAAVRAVDRSRPSLEDVFIDRVGAAADD